MMRSENNIQSLQIWWDNLQMRTYENSTAYLGVSHDQFQLPL